MRVLLIQPPVPNRLGYRAVSFIEPLGLQAVAGALVDRHEVRILDARLDADIERHLAAFQPQAVGITASFTADVYSVQAVLRHIRLLDPTVWLFVGGHHATLNPHDFTGLADAVVLGEGEEAAAELLQAWEAGEDPSTVLGVLVARDGRWVGNGMRPLIKDLDRLPLPARHLVEPYRAQYYHDYWRPCTLVETARGCPFFCKFCSVWKFYQRKCRFRSPERVVEDLRRVTSPYVIFSDDNFLVHVPRARRIAGAIREAGIRKQYYIQARSDAIVRHPEVLEEWREIGLRRVFVGFEAITQEGLEALNKHTSLKTNEEAVRILRSLDIEVISSFIVDVTYRQVDFAALANYVERNEPTSSIFTVLTPLPGTELFEERRRDLVTDNYELFDLQHAVLPTALPLREFYRQYTALYRRIYVSWRNLWACLSGGVSLAVLRDLWRGRALIDPDAYLQGHLIDPRKRSIAEWQSS